MEFLKDLSGSMFWAAVLSLLIYFGSSFAIGLLSKKSTLLKPIGSGLKLIALFFSLQVFLHRRVAEPDPVRASGWYSPRQRGNRTAEKR
jgi:hypothetical protein